MKDIKLEVTVHTVTSTDVQSSAGIAPVPAEYWRERAEAWMKAGAISLQREMAQVRADCNAKVAEFHASHEVMRNERSEAQSRVQSLLKERDEARAAADENAEMARSFLMDAGVDYARVAELEGELTNAEKADADLDNLFQQVVRERDDLRAELGKWQTGAMSLQDELKLARQGAGSCCPDHGGMTKVQACGAMTIEVLSALAERDEARLALVEANALAEPQAEQALKAENERLRKECGLIRFRFESASDQLELANSRLQESLTRTAVATDRVQVLELVLREAADGFELEGDRSTADRFRAALAPKGPDHG